MLNLNSLAASPCVISFFLVFFNATSRSLSTWVISSCPSCIPKAWGCQDDISTLLKDDILILLPHPKYPVGHEFSRVDAILITHGHSDHIHDAVPLAQKFSPQVVAIYETCLWLEEKGVKN